MKRSNKILYIAVILILILAALFIFLHINVIKTSAGKYISTYGYYAILLFSFVSELIDQPIGPETVASLGIVLGLNVYIVFILAIIGGWSSNIVGFNIGRRYFSPHLMYSCNSGEYSRYCDLFKKYGNWALMFSAFLFPYVVFVWISGAFHMKFKNFFWYGMIPRMIRTAVVLSIVRFFF